MIWGAIVMIILVGALGWVIWRGASTDAPDETQASQDAKGNGQGVTVIDPGEEPRRRLRLDVSPGEIQRLVLIQRMAINQSIAGQSLGESRAPLTEAQMKIEVTDVADSGDIHYALNYEKVEMHDEAGSNLKISPNIEQALQVLRDLEVRVVASNRGVIRSFEPDLGDSKSETTERILANLEGALERMNLTLPEQPVGPGAKWRFVDDILMSGIPMKAETLVSATKVTDAGYEADLTIHFSAEEQRVERPEIPEQVTMQLNELQGKSEGRFTHHLSRILPLGQTKASMNIRFDLEKGGQQHVMRQNLRLEQEMNGIGAVPSIE